MSTVLVGESNNSMIADLMGAAQYLNDQPDVPIDPLYLKGMSDLICYVADDGNNGPLSTPAGVTKHILVGIKGWRKEHFDSFQGDEANDH